MLTVRPPKAARNAGPTIFMNRPRPGHRRASGRTPAPPPRSAPGATCSPGARPRRTAPPAAHRPRRPGTPASARLRKRVRARASWSTRGDQDGSGPSGRPAARPHPGRRSHRPPPAASPENARACPGPNGASDLGLGRRRPPPPRPHGGIPRSPHKVPALRGPRLPPALRRMTRRLPGPDSARRDPPPGERTDADGARGTPLRVSGRTSSAPCAEQPDRGRRAQRTAGSAVGVRGADPEHGHQHGQRARPRPAATPPRRKAEARARVLARSAGNIGLRSVIWVTPPMLPTTRVYFA
ncbi:hypothetical protein SMICM304S_07073 [Streptomyces microflavus]